MKIVVCDPIGQSGVAFLKKQGYDMLAESQVADADAIIVRSRTKITRQVIDTAKRLKVIARAGTGVDNIDVGAATSRGIIVVNAPGANAESVAEHTMALILALTRNVVDTAVAMRGGKWEKSSYVGTELMGKTLGIVGFGTIGKRVGELAEVFGMKTLAYHRSGNVSLDTLLAGSDIITLHITLTDETLGLINEKALKKMKKTAHLINTSRGAVVDEEALITALKNKAIAGAALDVFSQEPLAPDSPLRKLSNVILTPHVAAGSVESEERASLMIAEDVDRVLKGGRPTRPVTL